MPRADIKPSIIDTQQAINTENKTVLAIHVIIETVNENRLFEPRPIWVPLIDHRLRVVYESLVKVPVRDLHTKAHDIDENVIHSQRPLHVVATRLLSISLPSKF